MNLNKVKNLKFCAIAMLLFESWFFTSCTNNKLIKDMDVGTRSLLSSDLLYSESQNEDFIMEITSSYTNLQSIGSIKNSQNNIVILADSNEAVFLIEGEAKQIKNVITIPKESSMVAKQVCEVIGNGYAIYLYDENAKPIIKFIDKTGKVDSRWYRVNGLDHASVVVPICGDKLLGLISSIVMDPNIVMPTILRYDLNKTLTHKNYINNDINLRISNTLVLNESIFLEGYSDDKAGFYLLEVNNDNSVSFKNLDPGARKDVSIKKLFNVYNDEVAGVGTYENYYYYDKFPTVIFDMNSINNSAFGIYINDKGSFLDGFGDTDDGIIACGYKYNDNLIGIDYASSPTIAYIAKISTKGVEWAKVSTNNDITKAKSVIKINQDRFYIVGDTLNGIFFGQLANNANSSCLFNNTNVTASSLFLEESGLSSTNIEPLNSSNIVENSTESLALFDVENFSSKFLCNCYADNDNITTTLFNEVYDDHANALDIIMNEVFVKHWDHVLIGASSVLGLFFMSLMLYCFVVNYCKYKKYTSPNKLQTFCCRKSKNYTTLEIKNDMQDTQNVDNEANGVVINKYKI